MQNITKGLAIQRAFFYGFMMRLFFIFRNIVNQMTVAQAFID